jgi:hypothetical protein
METIVSIALGRKSTFGQKNAIGNVSRGRGLRMNGDGGFGLGIIKF